MQIEAGQVVTLSYTATDENGNVLERPTRPVAYLHGHNNFIDAVEPALAGRSMGEDFTFTVPDAYGKGPSTDPIAVPKKEFPKNWEFHVGMVFTAPGSEGRSATLFVHSIRGSRVMVSPEHPWGGRTVTFVGVVLDVRSSTMDERQHGHAHGPGGHAH